MAFVNAGASARRGQAIIKVQRDFGNRADRKLARLKYLIHNWGLEKFKAKVEEYYGPPLADRIPTTSPASTTTSAGTSRATAAGSTA